jgi:hypothetical protein
MSPDTSISAVECAAALRSERAATSDETNALDSLSEERLWESALGDGVD